MVTWSNQSKSKSIQISILSLVMSLDAISLWLQFAKYWNVLYKCKEENPNQNKKEQLNRVKLLDFKIFLIIGDS